MCDWPVTFNNANFGKNTSALLSKPSSSETLSEALQKGATYITHILFVQDKGCFMDLGRRMPYRIANRPILCFLSRLIVQNGQSYELIITVPIIRRKMGQVELSSSLWRKIEAESIVTCHQFVKLIQINTYSGSVNCRTQNKDPPTAFPS
jgi:hypothetical protein